MFSKVKGKIIKQISIFRTAEGLEHSRGVFFKKIQVFFLAAAPF